MKTHQSLLTSAFVTFFGVMMSGSVLAASAGLPSSRVVSLVGSAQGLSAGPNSTLETVDLTGNARITTKSIPSDTTTPDAIAPASVVIDIEILNAKGKGRTTKQAYQSIGLDRSVLTAPLNPTEQVEADVVIFPVSQASLADRSQMNVTPAHVAFTLNFDNTGTLIGVAASPLVTPPPTNFQ